MKMVGHTNRCEKGCIIDVQGERKLIQKDLLIMSIQKYFLTIVNPASDVVIGPWTLDSKRSDHIPILAKKGHSSKGKI
jgi:hypothetical protein